MKRASAIVILSILLFNLVGFYFCFLIQRYHVRREMNHSLKRVSRERLDTIVFSPAEFATLEVDNNEIEIGSVMFDVASITIDNNRIILHGLYDQDETSLTAWLEDVLGTPQSDEQLPHQVVQFITLMFIVDQPQIEFKASSGSTSSTPYQRAINSFSSPMDTPPPRHA